MRKIIITTFLVFVSLTIHSQITSDILKIYDTRDINDAPNFNKKSIRADFKNRSSIGVPGSGSYSGTLTISPWGDASGGMNHQLNFNDGGIYYRQGHFNEATWRAWSKVLLDKGNQSLTGNLDVAGTIRAKEVKIEATGWSDFVFGKDYDLPKLSEVEKHINDKQHLPGIPSEKEVLENGVNVVDMQAKLLQKIEELTLYIIDQQKQIDELKEQLNREQP